MTNFSTLKNHLCNSTATVLFTKANGQIREMQCTLKEDIIPTTTQRSNHTSGDTMIVYDLEVDGWRSFRLDRVIEYTLE